MAKILLRAAACLLLAAGAGVGARAAGPALPVAERELLDRTAAAHADDSPVGNPVATTPPAMPVVTTEVVYATVGGEPVRGFVARPADAADALPGVVLIHEWWGLNDNIRDEARRLAGEGYVTLAVDLYGGETADVPPAAMKLSQALSANPAPAEDNLRQAVAWLRSTGGASRVGVIGWCLGGRWSLRTALLVPEQIDATVVYYGSVRVDEAELGRLNMPVLGIFAGRDRVVPLPTVREFEATMARLGKPLELHVYDNAEHGFANPSGGVYDPAAAEEAWRLTTAFFRRHLTATTR